jgi:hypothetical protein
VKSIGGAEQSITARFDRTDPKRMKCHLFVLLWAAVSVAALTCPGVCPNNGTMGLPDRPYNWSVLSETFTCAEWDDDLRQPYANQDGQEVCSSDDNSTFWIDMASYCGCDNYTQQLACDFCPSGNIINPDTLIVAPEGSDLEFALTCEQAAVATQYVSNENMCFSLKLLFAPSCCQEGQQEEGIAGTNASSSASDCSICPSGSAMQNPNRSLFFIGDGLTCESGQSILDGLANSDADCGRFDALPIDVAAWCGCSGTVPSESCPFCSRTSDGMLVSEDREVTIGNNVTVTCAEASEMAPYVNDPNACGNDIKRAIRDCCSGVPTASFPSVVPTISPTYHGTSAGAYAARRSRRAGSSTLSFTKGLTEILAPLFGLMLWLVVV